MADNVLIIGSGGREHALAWKLVQSPRLGKLYVAPGNGGTRDIAENVTIGVTAIGDTLQKALDQAYKAVCCIKFKGMQYRKDIGTKTIASSSNYLGN